jgi:hypothetical protein
MGYGPEVWGNLAQWASALGTTLGITLTGYGLFKRHRDERILEFDRRYRDRRDDLQNFWELLLRQWSAHRASRPNLPVELSALVAQAGAPPRADAIRDWPRLAEGRLTPAQRQLWDFARSFYPGGGHSAWANSAIKPEDDARRFHEAHGRLAWFWNTESMGVPDWHFAEHHADDGDLLVLLAWLEIALAQVTKAAGPGKTRLWRLSESRALAATASRR